MRLGRKGISTVCESHMSDDREDFSPPAAPPVKRELCRPFLKWAGAKTRVVPFLLPMFPANASRFLEPFVGSGAVFLNTNYRANLLSDSNEDIISLYRVLKQQGDTFIERCRRLFVPSNNNEEKFYKLRDEFNACSDPEHRAALFVYLNRHCFNGLCRYNQKGEFNTPFGRYAAPQLPEVAMRTFAEKLKYAELTQLDFRDVMGEAGAGDVVYCDPPYAPLSASAYFTSYSAGGFRPKDQEDLAKLCEHAAQRGAVIIVSNHDTLFTRSLYKGAQEIVGLLVTRTISCDGQTRNRAMELIARFGGLSKNPPPPPPLSKPPGNSAREWLISSGYEDVNKTIETIMLEWQLRGLRTRKDWWEKLAGTFKGQPCSVNGVKLPILKAARIRKGWPPVAEALCRNQDQPIPPITTQARWQGHRKS
jgi:DNA adenine methylase